MDKDNIFDKEYSAIGDFKFGDSVVSVFDDMVTRSVPFYLEMQRMITEMVRDFATESSNVYDLGCSTGTTLINLDRVMPPDVQIIGLDNSEQMLEKCENNFKTAGITRPYQLKYADLNKGVEMENASVAILCLTLQFVRPLYRDKLIADIYKQLNPNGCLIIIEKVLGEDSLFNRLFIKYYYDMKKRHDYSEMEISQKREALENVLIPYKLNENIEMIKNHGFRYCETFFKRYNFSGLIAVK